MKELVVSDSTCLIAFERIDRLDLLPKLFDFVTIPPAVDAEFGRKLDWLHVVQLTSSHLANALKMTVGQGEAEAIALAIQLDCQFATDDKQARSIAQRLGVQVIGALGILIQAKRAEIILHIRPIVEDLQTNGFRIGKALFDEVMSIADELD